MARCPNVEALNEDFLSIDPMDERFASVSHMYAFIFLSQQHGHFFLMCACSLLDPSCSGSGIVNRLDYLLGSGQLFSFTHNLTET